MKLLYTFLLTLSTVGMAFSQDFNIRGVIYDGTNGEPISDQKVRLLRMDSTSAGGAFTDRDGLFSIAKVNKGDYILQIVNFGFMTIEQNISVTKTTGNKDFTFEMKKDKGVKVFDGVKVTAEHIRDQRQILIGTVRLDQKGLERIPSTGGENDIVAAFSVTPGVVTTGDQGGQLYVRGGTPIQNKILLDGMTIYTPFHSIGFF